MLDVRAVPLRLVLQLRGRLLMVTVLIKEQHGSSRTTVPQLSHGSAAVLCVISTESRLKRGEFYVLEIRIFMRHFIKK